MSEQNKEITSETNENMNEKISEKLNEEADKMIKETDSKNGKKKYGMWCIIILAALVVVVGVVMLIRYRQSLIHEENDTRPIVSCEKPAVRDVVVYTEQIGKVMPADYAAVVPLLTGEILEVKFEVGDRVNEGDVLLVINSDSLDSLQRAVDAAKIQSDDAQTNFDRMQVLYDAGAISQAAFEQARSTAESAKLQYESAVDQYDLQKKYSNVTAPISGVIESRNAEVHGFTSPSSPIAVITAEGDVNVTFGITNESAEVLKPGDNVIIEYDGNQYLGEITEVGSMVSTSGLHDVKAKVVEDSKLVTGSRVPVTVVKNKSEGVMTIPMKAVFYAGDEAFVYVANGDKAEKKTFIPGLYDQTYIEIIDGIDASDDVITTWDKELYDGANIILGEQ